MRSASLAIALAIAAPACAVVAGLGDYGSGVPGDAGVGGADACGVSYREVVLCDAPLGYWRVGEAAGVTMAHDESTYAKDAVFMNVAKLGVPGAITGDPNTAITVSIDGMQGCVYAGDAFDFTGTAPFTLEAWVKPSTLDTAYRHLFNKDYRDAAGREQFGVYVIQPNMIGFERHVADMKLSVDVPLAMLNAWSHVVATYDSATLTLYVNGRAWASQADARPSRPKYAPMYLGCKDTNDGPIVGDLDEIAIYDHALSPERVRAHYAASSR